ncbi:hypothetical protein AAHB33_18870 [Paenarthrobacter sp. S56]|uniref:hypothetical protein n=1 Tax=Paenarthrobacter sp. S56 TaxID=3138179 RepID=UPI003219E34A
MSSLMQSGTDTYPPEDAMTRDDFFRFMQESLVFEDDTDEGLDSESLYGLYVSWCHVARIRPEPEGSFSSACKRQGALRRRRHHGAYTGLRMVGPAARDYAMHNDPCWSR